MRSVLKGPNTPQRRYWSNAATSPNIEILRRRQAAAARQDHELDMPPPAQFSFANIRLTDNSQVPLYRQIYDIFRKQIVSGRLKKNAHLPSEQEITEKLGVSRITVRRAFNELAASGFVTRQRGRGTVVTFNAAAPTIRANFDQLLEGLTRMGVETEVRLVSCALITPDRALRELLEVPSGEKLQRIVRLRLLDDEPFSFLVTHIPSHVAEGYDEEELATASLIDLLDRAGHRPRSATQTISATAAEGDAAKHLEVADGVPLLHIHRIMRDDNDEIVQEINAHYRADRFQYHMNLVRHSNASWSAGD